MNRPHDADDRPVDQGTVVTGKARPTVRTFAVAVPPPAKPPSPALWTLGVGLGVFAAVLVFWGRVLYSDTYTALAAGRQIASSGLPQHDTLTVSAHGHRWIDQQWLAHLTFFEAWRLGGYALVGALSAVAVAIAFALLFRLLVQRHVPALGAFVAVGLAFTVADLNLETRPQSFGYPLFLALLWILLKAQSRKRADRRLLWCWPILTLWGNLHGSVLLGLAACGSFALIQGLAQLRSRHLAEAVRYGAWFGGGVVCALITPYGTEILRYYPTILGNPNLRYIQEWQHAALGGPSIPFLLLSAITLGYVSFAWHRRVRPNAFLATLLTALAAMGGEAVRYQVWFSLVAVLCLCDLHGRLRPSAPRGSERGLGRVLFVVATVACLGSVALTATTATAALEHKTPPPALRETAEVAATHPGPILTDDLTGSALPWLYPKLAGRVAFDSRTEIFPTERFTELVRFLTLSQGWRRALSGYQIISVTCLEDHPALCRKIPTRVGWRVVYATDSAVVSVRDRGR
jgi:hypothetical protein